MSPFYICWADCHLCRILMVHVLISGVCEIDTIPYFTLSMRWLHHPKNGKRACICCFCNKHLCFSSTLINICILYYTNKRKFRLLNRKSTDWTHAITKLFNVLAWETKAEIAQTIKIKIRNQKWGIMLKPQYLEIWQKVKITFSKTFNVMMVALQ